MAIVTEHNTIFLYFNLYMKRNDSNVTSITGESPQKNLLKVVFLPVILNGELKPDKSLQNVLFPLAWCRYKNMKRSIKILLFR